MIALKTFLPLSDMLVSSFARVVLINTTNNSPELPPAICLFNQHNQSTSLYPKPFLQLFLNRYMDHHNPTIVPHPECFCGYHSIYIPTTTFNLFSPTTEDTLRVLMHFVTNECLAVVQPYGTVIEHQYGVRSEFLTILALVSPHTTTPLAIPTTTHVSMATIHKNTSTIAQQIGVPFLTSLQQTNQFINARLNKATL